MSTEITTKLMNLKDENYAIFHSNLIPNISKDKIIGVRVPLIRKLAHELKDEREQFCKCLPHYYYDENMLHGLFISEITDYVTCVKELDKFLPYVDNWAVCDCISPKAFNKIKDEKLRKEFLAKISEWIHSDKVYVSRFGIRMLMSHFLEKDFTPQILELPASVTLTDYYIQMMISWFFATALAKQWEATLPYITNKRLEPWIHNKTIQKAIESKVFTLEQKQYLRSLKIKKKMK